MTTFRFVSKFLDSNVFILKKGAEALIVDAGVEPETLKGELQGCKVCGVLLTHGHFDHAVYANEYAMLFGCKIYGSEKLRESLSAPDKNYSDGKFSIEDFSQFVFLNEDAELTLGSFDVKAIETPGHSKCSMSYLISGTLFAGDLLFSQGIGRTDLFGGDKKEMIESLKKVQELCFQTLASGHGETSTGEAQERNMRTFIRYLSRN